MIRCVLCKKVVSTYVTLSKLLYSCMIIVKNLQHTINITKLQKLVILMILLSTICTIVRIFMNYDNPTKTDNTGKTSPPKPSSCQNKPSYFQRVHDRLMKPLNIRWWAITKKGKSFLQCPDTAKIFRINFCTQKKCWNSLYSGLQFKKTVTTVLCLIYLVTSCISWAILSEISRKVSESVPFLYHKNWKTRQWM